MAKGPKPSLYFIGIFSKSPFSPGAGGLGKWGDAGQRAHISSYAG